MTPGARALAAIELLDSMAGGGTPADQIIDDYFRARRYAGSGDRRDIIERVYGVTRRRAKIDWWIERADGATAPDPRTRVIADLILDGRMAPDALAAAFSGARHCPDSLTERERVLIDALYGRPLVHRDMPDSVRLEYPGWMDRSFRALWGSRLETEMSALNQPAPLDLRVNTLKAAPEEALAALAADYVTAEPTPLSPIGIRVEGKVRLGGTRAYKDGLVEVQDEGSQLIALLTGAQPGMAVADFCAGAGGKTLALAALMASGGKPAGRLVACDVSDYRLKRMAPRLRRAGIDRLETRIVAARDDPWIAKMAGRFDRVLADVPCTGTGSWRRDPDQRWRFTPEDLHGIREIQARIADDAAALVTPGGRLIYATCSLLQEENEQQLGEFLARHPNFETLPIDRVWSETVGGPPPPTGPALRLSP
ncbi:MAG: RsmB/NOP family class I SAM-dependent RNA methyltransferase, partial [Proteobacteria bacterium]|nr:RsmB/NOP family class I SAM-dependent RNA methyltransferase [Pseudomonadota bacterium]